MINCDNVKCSGYNNRIIIGAYTIGEAEDGWYVSFRYKGELLYEARGLNANDAFAFVDNGETT